MMAKYREKANDWDVIEAEQFDGSLEDAARLIKLYPGKIGLVVDAAGGFMGRLRVTGGGDVSGISAGDWITRAKGCDLYTYSKTGFERAYEPIPEPAKPASSVTPKEIADAVERLTRNKPNDACKLVASEPDPVQCRIKVEAESCAGRCDYYVSDFRCQAEPVKPKWITASLREDTFGYLIEIKGSNGTLTDIADNMTPKFWLALEQDKGRAWHIESEDRKAGCRTYHLSRPA